MWFAVDWNVRMRAWLQCRGARSVSTPGGGSVFGVFEKTSRWPKLKEGERRGLGDEVQGAWGQASGNSEEPSKTQRWESWGILSQAVTVSQGDLSVWDLPWASLLALSLRSLIILVSKWLREMEVLSCVNYINWFQVQDHKYSGVFFRRHQKEAITFLEWMFSRGH